MEQLHKERRELERHINTCAPEEKSDLVMQLKSIIDEIVARQEVADKRCKGDCLFD